MGFKFKFIGLSNFLWLYKNLIDQLSIQLINKLFARLSFVDLLFIHLSHLIYQLPHTTYQLQNMSSLEYRNYLRSRQMEVNADKVINANAFLDDLAQDMNAIVASYVHSTAEYQVNVPASIQQVCCKTYSMRR